MNLSLYLFMLLFTFHLVLKTHLLLVVFFLSISFVNDHVSFFNNELYYSCVAYFQSNPFVICKASKIVIGSLVLTMQTKSKNLKGNPLIHEDFL
jgi:hypothetical protein